MEDIKTYELLIRNEDEDGIIAVSLVANPAIQTEFILLSEDADMQIMLADEEQQILMGPLLIPNQVIERTDASGNKYNLIFTEQKILELGRLMMRRGTANNIDIEHNGKMTTGFHTQELWFAGNVDKAHEYYPKEKIKKNTLMTAVHVPSKETWDALKASDKRGFSIEAMSGLKEILSEMDKQVSLSMEESMIGRAEMILKKDVSDEEKIGRLKQLFDVE